MELQDIYFVAEIGAAIAVVGSLIFVGIQLRQGNEATLASNAQAALNSWNQMSLLLATDDRLLTIQQKGTHPDFDGHVPDEDEVRYNYYKVAGMKAIESNFLQWQDGNLSDDMWQSFGVGLVDLFAYSTDWHRYWEQNQQYHPASFRELIDASIQAAELRRSQLVEAFSAPQGDAI
jgi:hypothetical protein